MQKLTLSALLFAALASVSLFASANESSQVPTPEPVAQQVAGAIDLNTADAETLQRELSGVGKVKAQAIVSYRETHGNFASVDELLEVKGIGEALLERNRSKLTVTQ